MKTKKIIIDFDNTFNLHGCDLDDFIALLYLLSFKEVEIPFVTTTFGNAPLENVNVCTSKAFSDFNLKIKFYSGSNLNDPSNIKNDSVKISSAVIKMHEYINANPNEVNLLALGSQKNFADLIKAFPDDVHNVKSFTAMGGITAPLIFASTVMNELNLSVASDCTEVVLKNMPTPNILTGNNCMQYIQYLSDIERFKESSTIQKLLPAMRNWHTYFEETYHFKGNVIWDVIAAMYIVQPQIFENHFADYELKSEQLTYGKLIKTMKGTSLNLPTLKPHINKELNFYETVFERIADLDILLN